MTHVDPDDITLDAIGTAITATTQSCHEAIERHNWQQVVALARTLQQLENANYVVRHARGR